MGNFNSHLNPQGYNLGGEPKNENPFFEYEGGGGGGDISDLVRDVTIFSIPELTVSKSVKTNADGTKEIIFEPQLNIPEPEGAKVEPVEVSGTLLQVLEKAAYFIMNLIENPTPDKDYIFPCGMKFGTFNIPLDIVTDADIFIDCLGNGYDYTNGTAISFDGSAMYDQNKRGAFIQTPGYKHFPCGEITYRYDADEAQHFFDFSFRSPDYTFRGTRPSYSLGTLTTDTIIDNINFVYNQDESRFTNISPNGFFEISDTKSGSIMICDSNGNNPTKTIGTMGLDFLDGPSDVYSFNAPMFTQWQNKRTSSSENYAIYFYITKGIKND